MQPWFYKEPFRMLVVNLFKTIGHFGMIRPMCCSYTWLNKKSIFK